MKKVGWKLNKTDVGTTYSTGSRNGRSGKGISRTPRGANLIIIELKLVHRQTGIQVTEKLPPGHFTKLQMQQLKQKAWTELFPILELKVAKALHIPGYFPKKKNQ